MGKLLRSAVIGSGYAVTAGLAIAFTRYHGGFATFWMATAFLSASLASVPRRDWSQVVVVSFAASVLMTGMFGLGWRAAFPIAAVNMLEAVVAASLMRRKTALDTLDSLQWFARFAAKVGLAAPLIGATCGSLALWFLSGNQLGPSWLTWFIGHALGGITFTPFFLLLMRGDFRRFTQASNSAERIETTLLFMIFFMATAFTFTQSTFPLLFFPLGPLSLICFRQDRVVATAAIATLAVLGAALTAFGHGPISLMPVSDAVRTQFFQFYLVSVVLTVFPITADLRNRKRLMRRVTESEQRFELLLENSTDAVFHLKTNGQVLYASPSVERLGGFAVSDFSQDSILKMVEPDWRDHVRGCHAEVISSCGKTIRYEFLSRNKDGETKWYEALSRAVCNNRGEVESVVSVVRDCDARKQEELGLIKEARIDGLTGLMNRRGFEIRFEALTDRDNVSLAILDIDHFKVINDQYGHPAGDRALQTFADVASRSIRKGDCLARIGGEEFAILLCGMTEDAANKACERLLTEISNSTTWYGAKEIRFTVSIGLTRVRSSCLDDEIARADAALYEAKRGGRDCLRLAA